MVRGSIILSPISCGLRCIKFYRNILKHNRGNLFIDILNTIGTQFRKRFSSYEQLGKTDFKFS